MSQDLRIENHGSICLVRPVSEAGKEWINNTAPDEAQFMGAAMAVEPRYLQGVIDAAQNDGMVVS